MAAALDVRTCPLETVHSNLSEIIKTPGQLSELIERVKYIFHITPSGFAYNLDNVKSNIIKIHRSSLKLCDSKNSAHMMLVQSLASYINAFCKKPSLSLKNEPCYHGQVLKDALSKLQSTPLSPRSIVRTYTNDILLQASKKNGGRPTALFRDSSTITSLQGVVSLCKISPKSGDYVFCHYSITNKSPRETLEIFTPPSTLEVKAPGVEEVSRYVNFLSDSTERYKIEDIQTSPLKDSPPDFLHQINKDFLIEHLKVCIKTEDTFDFLESLNSSAFGEMVKEETISTIEGIRKLLEPFPFLLKKFNEKIASFF